MISDNGVGNNRNGSDTSSLDTPNNDASPSNSLQVSGESHSTPSRQSKRPLDFTNSRNSLFQESPDNTASQLFSKPSSSRRRSSLFESLPSRPRTRGDTSSSTLLENDFHPSTLTTQSEQNSRASNHPSLFGAVMRRFGTAMGTTTSSQAIATPTRKTLNNFDLADENTQSLMSPSGKSIMTFVNRFVMNSPFRFQSPKTKRKNHEKKNDHANQSPMKTPSPRKKRRLSDIENEDSRSSLDDNKNWQEVPIHEKKMVIVDWTLKSKVKLECSPGNNLQIAMGCHELFESLTYWQYSMTSLSNDQSESFKKNGLKAQRLDEVKEDSSTLDQNGDLAQSPSTLASKLTRLVRGPTASLSHTKRVKIPNLGREWQEAFRSLYLKWCKHIDVIAHNDDFDESLSDFYFYSLAEDHIVLFCVDELDAAPFYKPRVVISNCSQTFQEKLESLGVRQFEYPKKERTESMDSPSPGSTKKTKPMSPNVKDDLEALRRAQAYGENAGADVLVKVQKKAIPKSHSRNERRSFSVSGFDNVSLFFEVYLNLKGRMSLLSNGNTIEAFPTLLCRKIGPFLHASLKSSSIYPVKSKESNAYEVEGILLPCAIRNIVGYLATTFVRIDQDPRNEQNSQFQSRTFPKEKDAKEPKYMVVHAATENQSSHPFKLVLL